MSKKNLLLSIALLSAFLFLFEAQSIAGRGRGPMDGSDFIFQELNLTEEQQDRLMEVKKDHIDRMQSIESDMDDQRYELHKLLGEKTFDEKKVGNVVNSLTELHREELNQQIDLIKRTKEVLTDEQVEKLDFMMLWQCGKGPHLHGRRRHSDRGTRDEVSGESERRREGHRGRR
jgi:Spy/CpxP family protein refolding chaperone